MSDKTPRVILLSHLPDEHVCAFVSNAGNRRRARRERGTVVQRSKPHMFFVPTCVFFPNYARTSKSHRKEAEKKHILLLTDDGEHVGGEVHLSPPPT